MAAKKPLSYYDDPEYDYQQYWQERKYENEAEKVALKRLVDFIPQKEALIDIGGGFGRLVPVYAPLFKDCLLVDPSLKLLKEAQKLSQKYPNLALKKGFAQDLPVKNQTFDLALLIRVIHHLTELPLAIKEVRRVLKPQGFLILEFANKMHLKNCLKALGGLNFKFFTDHRPVNIRQGRQDVPFLNYHPNHIKTLLYANGLKIIKSLSVSNFRHPLIKKLVPLKVLLFFESHFSLLASHISPLCGPSIFILAQKASESP